MHSHEACRVWQGKEKLMMIKGDVLQIRDRGTSEGFCPTRWFKSDQPLKL
ncbi:hypothetical protein C1H46_027108 [Malus baccata]|uniref:Uncharacterized protein n=1 Tax=Malus baccata TaxID=106549 RepID=A0A540LM81_MALBA|nr:hypothetical protein C1H46_027108 [Malus baccata]